MSLTLPKEIAKGFGTLFPPTCPCDVCRIACTLLSARVLSQARQATQVWCDVCLRFALVDSVEVVSQC